MTRRDHKAAKKRMDARFERLQALCARAYNVGEYDPLSESFQPTPVNDCSWLQVDEPE